MVCLFLSAAIRGEGMKSLNVDPYLALQYLVFASPLFSLAANAVEVNTAAANASAANKARIEEFVVNGEQIKIAKLTEEYITGSRLNISALDTPATIQSISGDAIRS